MSQQGLSGNKDGKIAPLRNIVLLDTLIQKVRERPGHLPGLGSFTGPSGYGKSWACAYSSANASAYYVEARSTWTRKSMLHAILLQMGITPERMLSDMVLQIAEQLGLSRRPLILDEADNLVERGLIELVRDLYEESFGTIILVGEERLPQKLTKWERVHGRVLDWVQAEPANLDDARALARLYCPKVGVEDDLLGELVARTKGSVRRICVNLEHIGKHAAGAGLKQIGRDGWGDRPIHSGEPPKARRL